MKKNEQKNQPKERRESGQGKPRPKRRGFSPRSVLTGSFLEKEGLLKQLPFILYISFLFFIYIANSYYGEKTIYEIEKNKSELVELRSEYISAKTRLTTSTNISKLSKKLEHLGIAPSHQPPGKIFVKAKDNE